MAASNASPFEVNDFSGGITDQVFDQSPNRYAIMDNFLIGGDRKPYMRFGSAVESLTTPQVPESNRVGALINYANNDKLFYQSSLSMYYRNPDVYQEVLGPSGNKVFSAGTVTSVPSFAQWNRHLYVTNDAYSKPVKIFKDGTGAYKMLTSGLPGLATSPVVTAGASGAFSYIYGFYYSYTYTVFGLTYETDGPVTEIGLLNSADPSVTPVAITAIPALANGAGDNYDVTNIKLNIYRTPQNGTFLQRVAQLANGTTSYSDSTSDATLQNTGIPLYTNDGTLDNDPPPLHRFNHVVNNTGYYAYVIDSDGESPYRIRQSIPGIPDTAPLDLFTEVDDEIAGFSSVNSMPVALCKKYIYRIDQFYDQFGKGNMIPVRISDNAGCISHNSIVQAESQLFWFGNDGVYYSDGYIVKKVSEGNNNFYKSILKNTTQKTRITGKFYEKERLIVWQIQRDSSNLDNDSFLVVDLKWGVTEAMSFSTWSGNSFRPSAIEIFNNDIYRGDPRGYTIRHDASLTSDPKINLFKSPTLWVPETIIWNLTTINYNFDGTFYRKYPTRILLTAADAGNTTIQITAINDDGRITRKCSPIRVRTDFIWRDDDFIWRVTDFIWRGAGLIEQWRRFPKGGLRVSTLQLEFTNGYSDITNSDTLGTATFDGTANTATLDVAVDKWPLYSEDYFIYTEVDSYTTPYLITERTSDGVITVLDPLNTFPTGSHKWIIRGYKKDEPLNLLGFNVHWTDVSATQETYRGTPSTTGENS